MLRYIYMYPAGGRRRLVSRGLLTGLRRNIPGRWNPCGEPRSNFSPSTTSRAYWKSLKTTNPIESVFDQVRLRINATRRMRSARRALYLVFQLVRYAQSRWRRIEGAHLVIKVLDSVRFIDGQEEVKASVNQVAA